VKEHGFAGHDRPVVSFLKDLESRRGKEARGGSFPPS